MAVFTCVLLLYYINSPIYLSLCNVNVNVCSDNGTVFYLGAFRPGVKLFAVLSGYFDYQCSHNAIILLRKQRVCLGMCKQTHITHLW